MLKMASQAAMLWCSGNPKRERYLTSDPQKISKEPLPVGLRKIRFQPDIAIQSIRSLCQRMVRGATPTLMFPILSLWLIAMFRFCYPSRNDISRKDFLRKSHFFEPLKIFLWQKTQGGAS